MANNLLKSLMKAYGQYSAFTNQGAMQNQSMNAKNPMSNSGNKNVNVKPIASNQAKQYAMPSMNKPKTTTNNGIYNQNKGGYQPPSPRILADPSRIKDTIEIGYNPEVKAVPLRMKDATPNYMTQYNNSATPKKSNKVSYAAEPMKSQINNQYYATRNNGAFNENGFQQFMQQAQQQQVQPPSQYAQPQPINEPDVLAQPQPVNNPDMFAQPMFGGTAKRMLSVKKSSKRPKIMKTYEYSPQRMHEGTGKPPKLPSTNRTIYSTKKFY